VKFVLFVEGFTESRALPDFLRRWLDTRVTPRVGIRMVRFSGWRDYCAEIGKKVALNLSGRAGADIIAAIGLLDLYGPTFYPADKRNASERYAWAKAHLEGTVAHPRFRQHFAVHETEAWLLSSPEILPEPVASALPGKCAHPETVNFDEPPARLLDRLYRTQLRRPYAKVIDGTNLFQRISPDQAHARCPYLGRLLDEMLDLARKTV
jgi:hypothetical protein